MNTSDKFRMMDSFDRIEGAISNSDPKKRQEVVLTKLFLGIQARAYVDGAAVDWPQVKVWLSRLWQMGQESGLTDLPQLSLRNLEALLIEFEQRRTPFTMRLRELVQFVEEGIEDAD